MVVTCELSIIIVNYKTPLLTKRCIHSIRESIKCNINYEIIIVDNNSNDDSEIVIQKEFDNVIWINNSNNDGFGRANNLGLRYSNADYVLFLNSDVVANNNAILTCLNIIKKESAIGVLGVKLLNEDGSVQNFTSTVASYRKILDLNVLFNYFIKPKISLIEVVMGSFMMIPKAVLNKCGDFDTDFFMYSEEVELCYRISENGYEIKYLDNVTVVHKNGGSTMDRTWANKQSYLSTALLFFKIRGTFGYINYHLLIFFNLSTNFFAMWFLDEKYRNDFWKDQSYYFSNIKNYLLIPFKFKRKVNSSKYFLKVIN